jgi:dipeptidyl aminopeptidase/acylaminoacyl peptidase
VRPEHLADYRTPSDPRMHPDGVRVAFTVTQMDLDDDRYERRIWLWDGQSARPLTSGPSDAAPRWSPDGRHLLFLRRSADEDAKPQVAVLPMGGGEADVVTDFDLGVTEAEWAPDGASIAVVAAEWVGELADLDADERKRRPRRFTEVPYRGDGLGWVRERHTHVWLVDPDGEDEPRCLTSGDDDEAGLAWHPSGTEIAFRSARHADRETVPGEAVFAVDVASGEIAERAPLGAWGHLVYDRNGVLHASGDPDPWAWPGVPALHRLGDEPADLTGHLDRSVVSLAPVVAPAGPQWLDDGSALCVLEDEGRLRVIRIEPNGAVHDIDAADRLVTGVSPRPDGSAYAFTVSAPTDPGELWWWEDGEERCLTELNAGFRDEVALVEPIRFSYDHDGVTIEGWVYLPEGDGRVPTLLNIHGGPATQYGYGFFDEFQVYAGAGYGVVATNPRGSSGYGHEHVTAVVGRWHEERPPDVVDILAAVDAAAGFAPRLDTGDVGIMGGSYGGLMTLWITALDHRFRSAVAERGLYNWMSFGGTSDIGTWFGRAYLGVDLFDDPDLWWRASPLALSQQVTTPTLVIHSESDFRTPVEQGEQLFAALRRAGVESELVRFPVGEGHELSRGGKPLHRRERFEIILDWHGRYLGRDGA